MKKSVIIIARRGILSEIHLLSIIYGAIMAAAKIGVKLGGCGISRPKTSKNKI